MDCDLPTLHVPAALAKAYALAEAIARFFLDTVHRSQGRPLSLEADIATLRKFFELLDEWDRE